jgi:chaperonin cofactor prefoldin
MSKNLEGEVEFLKHEIKILRAKTKKYEENFKVLVEFLDHEGLDYHPFTKKITYKKNETPW